MRVFAVLFAGFVGLHVLRPEAMARTLEGERGAWLGGLNVGMILGIGVILAALVLAVTRVRGRT